MTPIGRNIGRMRVWLSRKSSKRRGSSVVEQLIRNQPKSNAERRKPTSIDEST